MNRPIRHSVPYRPPAAREPRAEEGPLSCCDHCTDADSFFSRRAARRELKAYRRKGPDGITRELLDLVRQQQPHGTLLDIGGGVGVLQHELLDGGMASASHVDASRAYLQASRVEATRRGHDGRVDYHHGDFVELAPTLPSADVVTLDRVVCCYPDMPALVRASAAKARALYALSFPRVRPFTRIGTVLATAWFRIRRSSFRTYLHPPARIEREIEAQGFRRVAERSTYIWHAVVYRRASGPDGAGMVA